jgi:hypothetical protein
LMTFHGEHVSPQLHHSLIDAQAQHPHCH